MISCYFVYLFKICRTFSSRSLQSCSAQMNVNRWPFFSFCCRALQCFCSIVVVRHLCNSPNIDLTARSLSPSVINFEINTIKAIVEEIVRAIVKCSREIVGMFQVEMSTTRTMNVKICKHGVINSWVARLQHEFGMILTGHFHHIDF